MSRNSLDSKRKHILKNPTNSMGLVPLITRPLGTPLMDSIHVFL